MAVNRLVLYERTPLTAALDSPDLLFADLATRLSNLAPSAIHYEIVSLEDPVHLEKFVGFLSWLLRTKTHVSYG